MKIDVPNNLLPGKLVNVLNYRCRPEIWEAGEISGVEVHISGGTRSTHIQYRVCLNRKTWSKRYNTHRNIFVYVSGEKIQPLEK